MEKKNQKLIKMTEANNNFPTSLQGKTLKLQKIDIKKLQAQHEDLQVKLNSFKELLTEKDNSIKSQRVTLRLQDEKISQLSLNNDTLRHIVHVLSKHITEVLKETLPLLPSLPQDYLADIDSLLAASPQKKRKSKKRVTSNSFLNESTSQRHTLDSASKKRSHNYEFSGADILSAISDLQEVKKAAQQASKAQGRYTIITSHRISLFESLSFFLSLRNVAFLNNFEGFLPRVLEMITDLLDVERVILYVYDEEQFYSMAMTGEYSKQLVIPKGFSHLYAAIGQGVVMVQAYEDSRFDLRYDQISGFKTNNLACFPLKIGEDVIGMLECANKKTEFGKEDVVFLSLAAKQLALGVAGKLYQDKTQIFSEKSGKGLYSKDKTLLPTLKSIVLSVKAFVICEKVNLYSISHDSNELICKVSSDPIDHFPIPITFSFPGLCFTSKKSLIINNAHEHAMHNQTIENSLGITMNDLLVVPLGEFGVLECINKPKGFNNRDEAKAVNFAMIAKNLLEAQGHLEKDLDLCEVIESFSENIKECMVCVDFRGIVVKVNTPAAVLFGFEPEKIVGASITQLFEHADDFLRVFNRVDKEKSVKFEEVKIKNSFAAVEIFPTCGKFTIVISLLR